MPNISNQLTTIRKQRGWSQEMLASAANVSVGTIQNAEYGRPVRKATVRRIADALEVHYDELTGADQTDAIAQGPSAIRSYLGQWLTPPPEAYCHSEQEVRLAATKMVASFESDYLAQSSNGREWDAFDAAYCEVSANAPDIVESYVRAWQACNDSFLFAIHKGKRIGLSTIWPLSSDAYEGLRAGELSFSDMESSHVEPGSQNLFVNSAQELHAPQDLSWFRLTDSIFHLILFQLASMSSDAWDDSFRMICFTGTPGNQKRATGNGFESLDRQMAKIPFPLYEFPSVASLGDPGLAGQNRFSLKGVVGAFSPSRMKRSTLRGVIGAYQRVLGTDGLEKRKSPDRESA